MEEVPKLPMFILVAGIYLVQTVFAGTNPIANMPDYNGTYYGTPNTGGNCDSNAANCDSTAGRRMFNTLYRDNYFRESGCAGERCGSHAGVDINVPSGTRALAALAGTVVQSECKEAAGSGLTGGTVVIEANNPYASGKVWLVYAHLDKWDYYAKGKTVGEGAVIGLSGGDPKPKGKCPGSAQGAHLHFQVDKQTPDSAGRPWFPPSGAARADSDFAVTKYTHNPLPFVTGYAYNFTFAENGNKELWGATNVTSYSTANSALVIDGSSQYAYAGRSSFFTETTCGYSDGRKCSREITLNADIFKRVVLNLNFKCYNNPVTIWFRGPDDVWHGGEFSYSSAGKYMLNMSGLFYWKSIITDVMIQPSLGCTASPGPAEYFINQMYFLP